MKSNSISVALCTYNGGKYLREQLISISSQTITPDEVIICDDCSTDNIYEIIRDFKTNKSFELRYYKNESNLGITKNFNKAVNYARNDIILFSDQDDIWEKNRVELSLAYFNKYDDCEIFFSNGSFIDEASNSINGNLFDSFGFNILKRSLFRMGLQSQILLKHSVVTGATLAIKRETLLKCLPFNEKYLHDRWISFNSSFIGKIYFSNNKLIKYRVHANQNTGISEKTNLNNNEFLKRINKENYLREINFLQDCFSFLEEKVQDKKTLSQIIKKINHRKIRIDMSKLNLFKRIKFVTKEVFNFNYFKYSFGIKSIIRDLINL